MYNIAEEQNEFDKDKSYYYLNNNTNNNEDTNNNEEVEIVSNNSNSNSNECIEETINQTSGEDNNSKNISQTCPAIKSASEIPQFMQLNSVKPDTKEIVIYVKVIKKCEIKSFFNDYYNNKIHYSIISPNVNNDTFNGEQHITAFSFNKYKNKVTVFFIY